MQAKADRAKATPSGADVDRPQELVGVLRSRTGVELPRAALLLTAFRAEHDDVTQHRRRLGVHLLNVDAVCGDHAQHQPVGAGAFHRDFPQGINADLNILGDGDLRKWLGVAGRLFHRCL